MTAITISGIIEGFYGPPWSFADRYRALRLLSEHGGNTYVYAPKDDPLHRDRWREPYLPEDWEDLAGLARHGERLGVDVWFGLSPLGMRVSDGDDVARLLDKVEQADGHGLTDLCLLVDDMPEDFTSSDDAERFPSLAAAHARMVTTVREAQQRRGADRRLWFVPLHYHGDPGDAYVREIGQLVPEDVLIMWTGPEVCSETITAEHSEAVAASLQRPVLYWDNHPVNDGEMRHDPHLGPLRGRDPDLAGSTAGILANVAIEPEASLIAVATFLDYAADPAGYDPESAWRRALLAVTGDEQDAAAVAVLADLAPRSPLQRGEPRFLALDPLVSFERTWEREPDRRADALAEVLSALDTLAATAHRLERSLTNERLRGDLRPWSRKLRSQVTASTLAVEVLRLALEHPDDPAPAVQRRKVVALLAESRRSFHRVAGDRLEVFARGCLRRADELTSTEEST